MSFKSAEEIMQEFRANMDKAIDLLVKNFDPNKSALMVRKWGGTKYDFAAKLHITLMTEETLKKTQLDKVFEAFPQAELVALEGNSYLQRSSHTRIFLNPSK